MHEAVFRVLHITCWKAKPPEQEAKELQLLEQKGKQKTEMLRDQAKTKNERLTMGEKKQITFCWRKQIWTLKQRTKLYCFNT